MNILEEIRNSNKKPKDLVVFLSQSVKKDKTLLNQFPVILEDSTRIEKGILMETLELVS